MTTFIPADHRKTLFGLACIYIILYFVIGSVIDPARDLRLLVEAQDWLWDDPVLTHFAQNVQGLSYHSGLLSIFAVIAAIAYHKARRVRRTLLLLSVLGLLIMLTPLLYMKAFDVRISDYCARPFSPHMPFSVCGCSYDVTTFFVALELIDIRIIGMVLMGWFATLLIEIVTLGKFKAKEKRAVLTHYWKRLIALLLICALLYRGGSVLLEQMVSAVFVGLPTYPDVQALNTVAPFTINTIDTLWRSYHFGLMGVCLLIAVIVYHPSAYLRRLLLTGVCLCAVAVAASLTGSAALTQGSEALRRYGFYAVVLLPTAAISLGFLLEGWLLMRKSPRKPLRV